MNTTFHNENVIPTARRGGVMVCGHFTVIGPGGFDINDGTLASAFCQKTLMICDQQKQDNKSKQKSQALNSQEWPRHSR